MTPEQIESLADWGKQQEVQTKKGARLLRKAHDTPEFAALWETQRDELYSMGLVRKYDEGRKRWELLWWQLLPPEVVLARQQSLEKSRAADADVQIPVRQGLSYLGYQKAGIVYASERDGTLIGDEMGLGKTIQAIGLINFLPTIHRVLIVCPAHLKIKWYRELRKWLVRDQSVGIADGSCFPTTDIVIINFQILQRFPKKMEFFWDLVVIDEAHELRNPKAQRTKAILGYSPTKKERDEGVAPSSGVPAKFRVMLSGTPMANKPFEMFPLIHWLAPQTFANKWDYARRYCGWVKGRRGSMDGATNEAELGRLLRETCMIRRLKKDVLTELPPKRREVIELPAAKVMEVQSENEALQKFLDGLAQMKADVELAKASGSDSSYKAAVDVLRTGMHEMNSQIAEIRKQTAHAKVPFVVEHVRSLIEGGSKVILFAFHREVVAKYWEAFPGSVMVRGGISDAEKMRACDTFQNNEKCRLIVGNMSAMGTGLDLTAGDVVVFAEESWLPLEISQCEDRAHRIGQVNSVLVQHVVLEGSIDCRMAYATIAKQEIFERILDGRSKEEIAKEPLIPMPEGVTVTLREVTTEAATIHVEQLQALNRAIQALTTVKTNIIDGKLVKALAGFLTLTPSQGVLAKRLVSRYRAKVPIEIVMPCLGDQPEQTPAEPVSQSRPAPKPPEKKLEPARYYEAEQLALF
jgi:SWI/SNF-related matrix-associated actin-dependent regulator 1 of chromatin subfamily A